MEHWAQQYSLMKKWEVKMSDNEVKKEEKKEEKITAAKFINGLLAKS